MPIAGAPASGGGRLRSWHRGFGVPGPAGHATGENWWAILWRAPPDAAHQGRKLYTHIGTFIETARTFELLQVLSPGANRVVLKVRTDLRDKVAQAQAEARAIAAVNDPNVVTSRSTHDIAGRICISFQRVGGITLQEWAADPQLPHAVPVSEGAQGVVDAEDNARCDALSTIAHVGTSARHSSRSTVSAIATGTCTRGMSWLRRPEPVRR